MSECGEFVQNAWRKGLCANCQRPSSEHVKVSNQLSVNNSSHDKTSPVPSKRNPVVKNISSKAKTNTLINSEENKNVKDTYEISDITEELYKDVDNVKNHSSGSNGINLDNNSQDEKKDNSMEKDRIKRRNKGGIGKALTVGFIELEPEVIGYDGGIDNLSSEDDIESISDTSSGSDDTSVLMTEDEKQFAFLALENTLWNSDVKNLKGSLFQEGRFKRTASKEFEDIELEKLWKADRFASLRDCDKFGNKRQYGTFPLPRKTKKAKLRTSLDNILSENSEDSDVQKSENSPSGSPKVNVRSKSMSPPPKTSPKPKFFDSSQRSSRLSPDKKNETVIRHADSDNCKPYNIVDVTDLSKVSESDLKVTQSSNVDLTLKGDLKFAIVNTDSLLSAIPDMNDDNTTSARKSAIQDDEDSSKLSDFSKEIISMMDGSQSDDLHLYFQLDPDHEEEMIQENGSFADEVVDLLNDVLANYSEGESTPRLEEAPQESQLCVKKNSKESKEPLKSSDKLSNVKQSGKKPGFQANKTSIAANLDLSKMPKKKAPRPPSSPPAEPPQSPSKIVPLPGDPNFRMVPIGRPIMQQGPPPDELPKENVDFSDGQEPPESPKSQADNKNKKSFTSFFRNILRRSNKESSSNDVASVKSSELAMDSHSKESIVDDSKVKDTASPKLENKFKNPRTESTVSEEKEGKGSPRLRLKVLPTTQKPSTEVVTSSDDVSVSGKDKSSNRKNVDKEKSSDDSEKEKTIKSNSLEKNKKSLNNKAVSSEIESKKDEKDKKPTGKNAITSEIENKILEREKVATNKVIAAELENKLADSEKKTGKAANVSPEKAKNINDKKSGVSSSPKISNNPDSSPKPQHKDTSSPKTVRDSNVGSKPPVAVKPKPTISPSKGRGRERPISSPPIQPQVTGQNVNSSDKQQSESEKTLETVPENPVPARRRAKSPKRTPAPSVNTSASKAEAKAMPFAKELEKKLSKKPESPKTGSGTSSSPHTTPPNEEQSAEKPCLPGSPLLDGRKGSEASSPNVSVSGSPPEDAESERVAPKIELPKAAPHSRRSFLGKFGTNKRSRPPPPPSVKRTKSITESSLPVDVRKIDISGPLCVMSMTSNKVILPSRRNTISLGEDSAFGSESSSSGEKGFDDQPISPIGGSLENVYEPITLKPGEEREAFEIQGTDNLNQTTVRSLPNEGYLEPLRTPNVEPTIEPSCTSPAESDELSPVDNVPGATAADTPKKGSPPKKNANSILSQPVYEEINGNDSEEGEDIGAMTSLHKSTHSIQSVTDISHSSSYMSQSMSSHTVSSFDSDTLPASNTLPRPRPFPRRRPKKPLSGGSDPYVAMNRPNIAITLNEANMKKLLSRLTVSNLQTLQDIYNQIENLLSKETLNFSSAAGPLKWQDFDIYGKPKHMSERCIVYSGKYRQNNTNCQLLLLHSRPEISVITHPTLLRPSVVFSDSIPYSYLSEDFIKTSHLVHNSVGQSSMAKCYIGIGQFEITESLSSYLSLLREQMCHNQDGYHKSVLFIILQLLSAISHCLDQSFTLTEADFRDMFVLSHKDLQGKIVAFLPHQITHDLPQGEVICHFLEHFLDEMIFTFINEDEELTHYVKAFFKMKKILQLGKIECLADVRSFIEFTLWGPAMSDLQPSSSQQFNLDQALNTWLEMDKSLTISKYAKLFMQTSTYKTFTVDEFYKLKFLLKASPAALAENMQRSTQ